MSLADLAEPSRRRLDVAVKKELRALGELRRELSARLEIRQAEPQVLLEKRVRASAGRLVAACELALELLVQRRAKRPAGDDTGTRHPHQLGQMRRPEIGGRCSTTSMLTAASNVPLSKGSVESSSRTSAGAAVFATVTPESGSRRDRSCGSPPTSRTEPTLPSKRATTRWRSRVSAGTRMRGQ
jgi:hypothetical protein